MGFASFLWKLCKYETFICKSSAQENQNSVQQQHRFKAIYALNGKKSFENVHCRSILLIFTFSNLSIKSIRCRSSTQHFVFSVREISKNRWLKICLQMT